MYIDEFLARVENNVVQCETLCKLEFWNDAKRYCTSVALDLFCVPEGMSAEEWDKYNALLERLKMCESAIPFDYKTKYTPRTEIDFKFIEWYKSLSEEAKKLLDWEK